MATIGRQRRQYVKDQFAKMAGGGTLVSDQETSELEQKAQSQAEQNVLATQQMLNRQAMAAGGGGGVMAGAMTQASQQAAKQAAGAAVKATGEAQRYKQALHEKRAAQAMAAGERLVAQNREDLALGLEQAWRVGEATGILAGNFGGG